MSPRSVIFVIYGTFVVSELLKARRRGVGDNRDPLRQGARRLLAQLDGHPPGGAKLGGEEVDVERVAEGRVHRVVKVDGAVGDLDPAGGALGATLDGDLLGDVRAHKQRSFRLLDGLVEPRATRLPAAPAASPARSSEIIPLRSLATLTNPSDE